LPAGQVHIQKACHSEARSDEESHPNSANLMSGTFWEADCHALSGLTMTMVDDSLLQRSAI